MLFETQRRGKSPPPPLAVALRHNAHAFCSQRLSHHYGTVYKPEQIELSGHHHPAAEQMSNQRNNDSVALGFQSSPQQTQAGYCLYSAYLS